MPQKHVKRCLIAALAVIMVLVSSLSTVSARSGLSSGGVHTNIVGGDAASQSFMVSLQSIDANGVAKHECGGVLVAPNWVMTAAHCAPFVTGQARLGSVNWRQGGEVVRVAEVFANPAQVPSGNFGNDIALVRLDHNAAAPTMPIAFFGPVGSTGLTQGWGLTCDTDLEHDPACAAQRPDLLQQLAMRRADDHFCDLRTADGLQLNDPKTMMCLVTASGLPAGACFGDSGSPYFETIQGKKAVTGIMVAIMNNTELAPHVCSRTPSGGPNRDAATKVVSQLPWLLQTLLEHDPAAAEYILKHLVF